MCTYPFEKTCDMASEIYGILLFASVFTKREIRIITANNCFASRLRKLFGNVFDIEIPLRQSSKSRYVFNLTDKSQLSRIFERYSLESEYSHSIRLNRAIIEDECCINAFIRGAFLAGGSVSNPKTSYHLELVTPRYNLSRELMALLMDMELEPKITTRKSSYVIYFKYSEAIEELLTRCGASVCAMDIMTAKIEKDVRNKLNRRVNCETANISKTVGAAVTHIDAIKKLMNDNAFDALPESYREAAKLRCENPEFSLSELAAMSGVNKATLNYRLNRIKEAAKRNTKEESQ
ncbi:MAG: DNA-binding protein WhiA [Clostridiales bacterium]|nr:DNA-binding protein WhiA [Clostridiales bacterium]